MANKKSKAMLTRSFSTAELSDYAQLTVAIEGAQKQADGLARTIAGALSRVKARKLYEIDGYKNIYEYGEQRHGIARGTVSDAINVYERFQNPDKKGTLLPEFEPFAWRALIMMKSIPTNEAIHQLGITYDMKSAEIKQRVQDYKEASELIELKGDWNYETVKQAIEDSNAITTTATDTSANGGNEADNLENNPAVPESAGNNSTNIPAGNNEVSADSDEDNYTPDYVNQARNMMTPDEWEVFEDEESEDLFQACADYVNNFNEFPKRTVNIKDMSEKDALAAIKKLLAGAKNGEYDIIITA